MFRRRNRWGLSSLQRETIFMFIRRRNKWGLSFLQRKINYEENATFLNFFHAYGNYDKFLERLKFIGTHSQSIGQPITSHFNANLLATKFIKTHTRAIDHKLSPHKP